MTDILSCRYQVHAWFTDFTRGEDIDFVSLINIASIADSISGTSAAVTGVTSAIWSAEEPTRKSLDIGILRYPDSDNSVFKVTTSLIRYFALILI